MVAVTRFSMSSPIAVTCGPSTWRPKSSICRVMSLSVTGTAE
jgi:hypothetical protein